MKVNNENFDKVLNKLVASTRSPTRTLYGREQLEAAGKPFAKAPQHEAVLDAYSQCRSRSPALCNELGSLSVLIRSTTTGSHSHRSHTYYRGNPSNP